MGVSNNGKDRPSFLTDESRFHEPADHEGNKGKNLQPAICNLQPIDILVLLGICLLILFAFWHVGPAGRVVAGGDLFSYFYPYWAEATRAFRAGRLPLWNPTLFMGVPLLANSQVGVLYPPNWFLWLLLPAHRSLHWSIVLHLCLAAVGTYGFARRSLRSGRLGAGVAALTFALGGYLGAQFEHVNQIQALAWFPWMLLFYDRAARSEQGAWLALAGRTAGLALVVGLTLLAGHTQAAFIALVGLAIYGLGPSLLGALQPWSRAAFHSRPERLLSDRPWYNLVRRFLVWAVAIGLGAALAAAQLLPTFELTGLSIRSGGLPFNERVSFSLSPLHLARAFLPAYRQTVAPEMIEYVSTIGAAGVTLLLIFFVARARRGGLVRYRGLILLCGMGLFLSLGLYNPVYLVLARFVPGFAHFRVPARWLALFAFGAAVLIGVAVETFVRTNRLSLSRRMWLVVGGILAVILVWGGVGGQVGWLAVAGWIVAVALSATLIWAAGRNVPRGWVALGMSGLVLAELFLSARTLPHAQATAPQAYTSLRPAAAHLLALGGDSTPPDRFLSLSALVFDPGDLQELRVIYGDQLSDEALYDLIISAKQREVLSPNLPLAFGIPAVDGYDGGVLPLSRYIALQRAFLPADQVSTDGRLRENLTQVPDGRWLSLFGVRYVITDKVFDAWIDDVFYDLQFTARLSPAESAAVAYVPDFEATALGLVSYLDGAEALPDGTPVGEVTVEFADGTARTFPLRAGQETAEGLYGPEVAHTEAEVGGHFWPGQPEGTDYVARLRWDGAAEPISVTVRATLSEGTLVVRGVSLIDERTQSFYALNLSDRGLFRLVHSGDVKVYENLGVLGRATIFHHATAVDGADAALTRMQATDFDPTTEIVVERSEPLALESAGEETACVVDYAPERVEVQASLTTPGYLVLTDAAYPGWQVSVDGGEAEIVTADLLFRAVRLDPGEHRVVFSFEPAMVRIGSVLSLVALVGAVGLVLTSSAKSQGRPDQK